MARGDDHRGGSSRPPGAVDQLLSELVGAGRGAVTPRALTDAYLTEDPPTLNVTVDIAGLDPDTLEVILDGEILVIRGDRKRPAARGRRVYQHIEIDWGPFERRIRIQTPVDPATTTVTYERGLLQIALPLAATPVVARVLIGVRIAG